MAAIQIHPDMKWNRPPQSLTIRPWKKVRVPIGKDCLPSTSFQRRAVKLPWWNTFERKRLVGKTVSRPPSLGLQLSILLVTVFVFPLESDSAFPNVWESWNLVPSWEFVGGCTIFSYIFMVQKWDLWAIEVDEIAWENLRISGFLHVSS